MVNSLDAVGPKCVNVEIYVMAVTLHACAEFSFSFLPKHSLVTIMDYA